MTQESPERPTSEYGPELRALIDDWRADAEKISQTVGVEPTTLIRCAEDLEKVIDDESPEQ